MSELDLVVAGAHLRGQPLNGQLTELAAVFVAEARTRPVYRFYALDTTPPKPGLVWVGADAGGASIEVERWRLEGDAFARFLQLLSAPLCIGRVELEDGSSPLGFLCEPRALLGARDITHFGGWRAALVDGRS